VHNPLLEATLKAKGSPKTQVQISVQHESSQDVIAGAHLEGLNQPVFSIDDESDTSIGSSRLFDAPKPFLQKPLLAAALKAKEDSHPNDSAQDKPSQRVSAGAYLEGLNQLSGSGFMMQVMFLLVQASCLMLLSHSCSNP
jgi:hypothetical protein